MTYIRCKKCIRSDCYMFVSKFLTQMYLYALIGYGFRIVLGGPVVINVSAEIDDNVEYLPILYFR